MEAAAPRARRRLKSASFIHVRSKVVTAASVVSGSSTRACGARTTFKPVCSRMLFSIAPARGADQLGGERHERWRSVGHRPTGIALTALDAVAPPRRRNAGARRAPARAGRRPSTRDVLPRSLAGATTLHSLLHPCGLLRVRATRQSPTWRGCAADPRRNHGVAQCGTRASVAERHRESARAAGGFEGAR